MKIVDVGPQGSEQWIEYRKSGIGSSDIACIMGCGFSSKSDIFYEKCGFKDPFVNSAMRRGNEYEEEARKFICNRTGVSYTPICVEHDEISYFRASLDGYNPESNTLIEIKVPSDPKAFKAAQDGIIPEKYQIQIQWQLMISGAKSCFYCVYDPISIDCVELEVFPDLKLQEILYHQGLTFWKEFESGILKEEERDEYLEIDGDNLDELEKEYRVAHLEAKLAEERLARVKSKILDLGDDGNFKFGKIKCTKMKGKSSYDWEKMKRDGIDIQKYAKFGAYYYKITLEK